MWFLVFFLISDSALPVGACGIVFTPERVVVGFGSPLVANCSLSSCDHVEGLGWESSLGGTSLTKGVYSVPFNVDKVKTWEIEPLCYISFSDNQSQIEETLPITIYQMPTSVSVSDPSERGFLLEGQKYAIECDVRNVAPARHLSVFWHSGKKMIHKNTFNETSLSPVNISSAFNLSAHRDDHDIWCEAKLDLWPEGGGPPGTRSQSLKITVLYSPNFIHPENETLEISTDSRVNFNCAATGNPEPVYSWSFARPTQEETPIQDMNDSTLTPEFPVLGIYSCTASNQQGSKTKYFIITEAKGNKTTFAAILGVFIGLGALVFVAGLVFVTPNGTFSFNKGNSGII